MEEKIKKIIAVFLQKEPSEINASTLINSRAISGSILIHRMYRELSLAGFTVEKYIDINTYGDLLNRLNGKPAEKLNLEQPALINMPANQSSLGVEIAIDIENISNFPAVNDYREDPFYKTNFTNAEISYCILKPNSMESFAGLFCLKEAICKTNENLRKIPFNQIEITHTAEGKPEFKGYALSVSHTKELATGVAVANNGIKPNDVIHNTEIKNDYVASTQQKPSSKISTLVSLAALLLSLTALAIEIFWKNK